MGAALAAIVALVVSPGEYGKLSSIIGATLLFVISAFYRLDLWPDHLLHALLRGMALAAVTGLCATLLIAWPVQIWVDHNTNAINYCYDIYENNNGGIAPTVVDAYSNCLGDRAFQPLAVFWLGFTVLGTLAYYGGWKRWKKLRDDGSKALTQPAEATGEGRRVQTTMDHHAEDVIAAIQRGTDLSERIHRLLIATAVIDGVLRVAALIDVRRRPAGQTRSRKNER